MNISDWYERVNERWPAEVPPLTPEEAVKASKSLYLCAIGKRFTGTVRVTSGNRYTWIRGSEMVVNPDKKETIGGGWAALIHDLSHYAHRTINPTIKPHSKEHARLELKMVNHVIKSGWLDGKLKPKKKVKVEPTKGEERLVKYQRVLDSIKRWEAKAKRAETYLKKLNRSKRSLERHL